MQPVPACTIASNNYLAFARVLAESYQQHHPSAPFYVCVVDRPHPAVRYEELPFTTVFAHELGIPAFDNFAFRYDILELNTAVKPSLLAHLRDRFGADRVFYLDPDILVCDRLSGLEQALDRHQAVLTPHVTRPLDNRYRPAERSILQAGVYNLGFLGIRLDQTTAGFLDWWRDRLARFCLVDLPGGLFVDQSWMDLAPAYLETVAVVRDPIYNIAYWNLAHRMLDAGGDHWRVEGRRVGFFHFSGIDLDDLEVVSRHQDRIRLDERPDLAPCFARYRELVLAAGHRELHDLPYGYRCFRGTEVPIPATARRTLRRVDPSGVRWPDPFDAHASGSYYRWLIEPLEFGDGWLNRAVLALWEERADLVRHFPDVCDQDLRAYAEWLTRFGGGELAGLDANLLAGVRVRQAGRGSRPARSRRLPQPFDGAAGPGGSGPLESLDLRRPGRLAAWLNQPVPGVARARPQLTHLSLLIHASRTDLQQAFPDPLDRDQIDFALWFVTHAQREARLAPSLVRPVRRSLPWRVRARHAVTRLRGAWRRRGRVSPAVGQAGATPGTASGGPEPEVGPRAAPARPTVNRSPAGAATTGAGPAASEGVNLAGYFDASTGVGQMGRATARALETAGTPFVRVPLDRDPAGQLAEGRLQQPGGAPYPVTLIHANADETPNALARMPAAVTAGSHKIGYWFWELAHFPLAFADRFDYLDELWAPSRFCFDAYRALSTIPVRLVPPYAPPPAPPPVAPAASRSGPGTAEAGLPELEPDRFWFLFAFDVLSVPERKNPEGAIEALRRLRSVCRRPAGLVLKVSRATQAPQLLVELRERARGLPVVFHTTPTGRDRFETLLGRCDAVLSLHRSEGLGLLLIEALYLEKPVVATSYGGVIDYLDAASGYPVTYEMTHLDRALGPYPAGAVWADPRIDDAVEQMRRVIEQPDEASERAATGRRRVEALYGLEAATQRYKTELARVFSQLRSNAPTARPPTTPPPKRLAPLPETPGTLRGPAPRRLAPTTGAPKRLAPTAAPTAGREGEG